MAAQICQAVAYIHTRGITHRDLKPENILLTRSNPPICKVADFGLSKIMGNKTFMKTLCGTPAYLAPEVMTRYDKENTPYDNKVDSFSLGVIFFCMYVFEMIQPGNRLITVHLQVDWPGSLRFSLR